MEKIIDPTVVDKYHLDEEWANQGRLRRNAGDDQADVADKVRAKKSYLKFRTAQIAHEYNVGIRKIVDAEGNEIKKPTVGALKSVVECDEELYALEKEINSLQKELDICANYTTAIDHKKYALQDEVKLYLSGYFAEPVDTSTGTGKNYTKEMEERELKESESENRQEVKRRRRKRNEEDDV